MRKVFVVFLFFIIESTQFCHRQKDNKNEIVLGLLLLNSKVPSLSYPVATRVYGQAGSFSSNTANNGGGSANSLYAPHGIVLDSNGGIYISDKYNGRVLYYPSSSTTATRVYGQSGSFESLYFNLNGISANSLYNPTGLALDSNNGLYVADNENSRVLYFPSNSTTATRVYGQNGSFTTNTQNNGGVTANSLGSVLGGLTLDANGGLYIVDTLNYRVLFFPSGSTTASRVYGQLGSMVSNTTNNENTTSANNLYRPRGLAVDSSGGLFIADGIRVLYFPAGKTTATKVYGQNGNMSSYINSRDSGISASTLGEGVGLAVDASGRLFVADEYNNRVLYY